MTTIAELLSYQPGAPVIDLRCTVKKAFETNAFGKGHKQGVILVDQTGESRALLIDCPQAVDGQPVYINAVPKTVNVRGQQQTEYDHAYTEVYNGNFRLTIKAKAFSSLATPPPAYQQPPPPPPAQQPWQPPGQPQAPVQPPAYAGAPPGAQPWQAQQAPPAAPPAQRTPDPAWMSGQQPIAPQTTGQGQQRAAWTPKPKMTDGELRELLVEQFGLLRRDLAQELGTQESALEAELLAGCMAWSTSIAIGVQRGDVELEQASGVEGGGQAVWSGDPSDEDEMPF